MYIANTIIAYKFYPMKEEGVTGGACFPAKWELGNRHLSFTWIGMRGANIRFLFFFLVNSTRSFNRLLKTLIFFLKN